MTDIQPDRAESDSEIAGLHSWVRLPSVWIEERGLTDFTWARGQGADNIAALMALAVIAHHASQDNGAVRLTWSELCDRTYLSRAKLGNGLDLLAERKLILRGADGRSRFQLSNFDPAKGWAMIPAKALYNKQGVVQAFKDLTKRKRAELDALKLYFLFAARRNRDINAAQLSYDKIVDYCGVHHNNIRAGLSVLAGLNMVHISSQPSAVNEYAIANQYRLVHLDPRRHNGTIGRQNL